MEHVCNETDGRPWHYDKATKSYYRAYKNGRHEGRILGEHLMNPQFHWDKRREFVKKFKGAVSPEDEAKIKPYAVSWALWNHWQRRK
jgi:hypothetical protein